MTETPSNIFGTRKKAAAIGKLAAVREYIGKHPTATVRQVMDGVGLASPSYAHRLLKEVRADLCVCPTCGGRGSIRTSASEGAPSEADLQLETVLRPTR